MIHDGKEVKFVLRQFGDWLGIQYANGKSYGIRPETCECYELPDDRCPLVALPKEWFDP